ncbi:shikimate kinase [Nostoc flagelliforme]|nr:shikimate kinase [Nostoc flagelliforme]
MSTNHDLSIKLPILLIGPQRAGKSTIGKLLSEQLNLPFVHLEKISENYWQEIGCDKTLVEQAWEDGQSDWVYRYMMPFDVHALKRAVVEYCNYIIELAAPQSVYDDAELFQQVSSVFQSCGHVILLLPSEDVEESLQILQQRTRAMINGMEINEYFVKHHSNYDLAKYIIYTKDKTPQQTSEEILATIKPNASDIILIGPVRAGKSTIGRILAKKLQLPQISMDILRWNYYQARGWDKQQQQNIAENEGFAGVYRYWKQFEAYAVERLLQEHQNCVIDFGAGHSIYEDDADFHHVSELLADYANVVLLMPSPDPDESVMILNQRLTLTINGMEENRFFLTHQSNYQLATLVIYTHLKTPSQIKDEILQYLELTNS